MLQNCEFFTVFRQFDQWGRCSSVDITINEDCDYQKIIEEFAKKGIFFSGCKAAAPASIIFDNIIPGCVVTGTEDDGTIYFSRDDVFHADWIPDFIDVLTKVSDFINE